MHTLLAEKETQAPYLNSKRRFDFTVSRAKLVVWLELISYVYLGLPLLMFTVCWLKSWYAIALSTTLIGGIAWEWYKSRKHYYQPTQRWGGSRPNVAPISWWQILAIALIGTLWACHSGAGGYARCNGDWIKHFAVLKDLTLYHWPVVYEIPGKPDPVPLVYYIAYYLPAAFVGKYLGWKAALFALQAYTAIGIVLGMLWFALAVGRRFVLTALILTFLGGLDFFGNRLVSGKPLEHGMYDILQWWLGFCSWQYSANWSLLVFVPQHMIGAWVATGLLINCSLEKRSLSNVGLIIGLTLLWSPFVFVGLLPFGVFLIFQSRFRGAFSITNILFASLLGALLVPYFASHSVPLVTGWKMRDWRVSWNRLGLFLLFEVGFYMIFCRELRRPSEAVLKLWGTVCVGLLLLIPFYQIGAWNDFCMRASIPALFVLWVFVMRELMRKRWSVETRILATLVLMGSFTGMHEVAHQLGTFPQPGPQLQYVNHVFTPLPGLPIEQYLGDYRAPFFTKIMKKYNAQPVTEAIAP